RGMHDLNGYATGGKDSRRRLHRSPFRRNSVRPPSRRNSTNVREKTARRLTVSAAVANNSYGSQALPSSVGSVMEVHHVRSLSRRESFRLARSRTGSEKTFGHAARRHTRSDQR